MAGSFLDSLTERYSTLTRSEKKLAGYIFANSTEVQYLSINSLAENSGVSEATITRFCQKMGLLGYNNLKIALAKSDYSFNQRQQVSETMSEHPKADDVLGSISRELFDSYILSLRETIEQLSPDSFNRAVELLSSARHVYCFGQGAGMVMAMETSALFSTISPNFVHISDSHLQIIHTALATSEDVILFFSYSGSTKDVQELLNLAKERSVPIILITHFPNSPAAELAEVTLICGYNENPIHAGSVSAKMGQLLLIDCLFQAFCIRNPDEILARRVAVSEAVSRKLL